MAVEYVQPKTDGDIFYDGDANAAINIINAEAGENLTAGQACYVSESDGEAYQSDKDASADNKFTGIALNTANSGTTVYLQCGGNYRTTGLTAKEIYYTSTSAGGTSTTISSVPIGVATSTTNFHIFPTSYVTQSCVKYIDYTDSSPASGRTYTFTPRTADNIITAMQISFTYSITGAGHGDFSFYINNSQSDVDASNQAYDIVFSATLETTASRDYIWSTIWPVQGDDANSAICETSLNDGPAYDVGACAGPLMAGQSSYTFGCSYQNHTATIAVSAVKMRIWWIEGYKTETGLITT